MEKRNMSLEQLMAAKVAQHVQSFQTMIENEYTAEEAWQAILDRTSFGPALLASLKEQCFATLEK